MGREDAAAQCCGREEKELWGGREALCKNEDDHDGASLF